MGNRRTDPWSQNLQAFTESSEGWPRFMRIFPILDWDYCSIWNYLRKLELPYCSLYDEGFTSIGERHNSRPNPRLMITAEEDQGDNEGHNDNNSEKYRPAYELTDGNLERLSRI